MTDKDPAYIEAFKADAERKQADYARSRQEAQKKVHAFFAWKFGEALKK